jgi:hypothetical protein
VHGNADSSGTENKGSVERMIAKYSEGLEAATNPDGKTVILLTGSTGGLGSHILEILLRLSSVERVYAFNRRGKRPVSERQREAFLDRALDVTLLSTDKLVFLEGDTAKEDLGLPPHIFTAVISIEIDQTWC